ncbi:hypothetical protein SEA_PUPPER_61 [Gordonia phage Pupper]|uniref:Uncharacterized protein n=1 Tax=Gordonia phage Pupper TaxID=2571249 RepID=A0A4Y6EKH8_9CAUD|nr:hypothetical protein KHQ83_gp216 [Gordonia phage Pupper]QDF18547.1 hypothetical protein SEA_PUPPER_61 [Gordonia phage Pupper]
MGWFTIPRQVDFAEKAGWDVERGQVSFNTGSPGGGELSTVVVPNLALRRGYVRYFLLHVGWICDECGARVPVGQFQSHATGRAKGGHG